MILKYPVAGIAERCTNRQNNGMHIVLRDEHRRRLFSVEVDLSSPPTIVHSPAGDGKVAHLNWDRALDDDHCLRRCPACGCPHLFVQKAAPQLMGFVLVFLAAVVALGLYHVGGYAFAALLVVGVVVMVSGVVYVLSPRELVCYGCRSVFRGMPIRRDHPHWQKSLDERYRPSEKGDVVARVQDSPGADVSAKDRPTDRGESPEQRIHEEPSFKGASDAERADGEEARSR